MENNIYLAEDQEAPSFKIYVIIYFYDTSLLNNLKDNTFA